MIAGDMTAAFCEQGFVVVPGVLSDDQLATGRDIVAALLEQEPAPDGHAGPYSLWPQFPRAGHPLASFYRLAGIGELASQLLRSGHVPDDPGFAQVAITFPPWPHRPGGPHVDGLTPPESDGRPGTFSMLAGVWLTDHSTPDRGNLHVWPGTHLQFGDYLARHGADALNVEDLGTGPYPPIELGEPVQVTGPAGSVLFAHYLLAHNTGGYDAPAGSGRRETIYYRLQAHGHRDRWRQAVTDPLLEFRPP
jgi:hypothetical protein